MRNVQLSMTTSRKNDTKTQNYPQNRSGEWTIRASSLRKNSKHSDKACSAAISPSSISKHDTVRREDELEEDHKSPKHSSASAMSPTSQEIACLCKEDDGGMIWSPYLTNENNANEVTSEPPSQFNGWMDELSNSSSTKPEPQNLKAEIRKNSSTSGERNHEREDEWTRKEETLMNSLRKSKRTADNLRKELHSLREEFKRFRSEYRGNTPKAQLALKSILKSEIARPLEMVTDRIGLVFKVCSLWSTLNELKKTLENPNQKRGKMSMMMCHREGVSRDLGFPVKPEALTEKAQLLVAKLNQALGNPGVNVIGVISVTPQEMNITELFHNSPTNVIWINVTDSPIVVKISSSEESRTELLNPGFGITVGKRRPFIEVSVSCGPSNFEDLFQINPTNRGLGILCLTACTNNPSSWLNALNAETPAEPKWNHREMSIDSGKVRPPIRARLEILGIPLRRKAIIRVAPIKDAGLPSTYLESKVSLFKEWIENMKILKPDLALPELKSVVPEWETPRSGNRFKVLLASFKSDHSLSIMLDLLHGSKIDILSGFPEELETIRDKIYVSLVNPYRRRGRTKM